MALLQKPGELDFLLRQYGFLFRHFLAPIPLGRKLINVDVRIERSRYRGVVSEVL
jgi:hypothetical protein